MNATTLTLFLLAFQIKHFVCDYPLQTRAQYTKKGIYGHVGGIIHATIHFAGTMIVFLIFIPESKLWPLALIEAVLHYHIDWAKIQINTRMKWGPTTSEKYWWLLGFDQLLHQLTYLAIVWYIATRL